MWQRRVYIRCAIMDDRREWEKARQVVEAIQRIMVGGEEEKPTAENPVISSTALTGTGATRTETKVKKILNVDYDARVKELAEEKKKVDSDGAAAVQRLKEQWAKKQNG